MMKRIISLVLCLIFVGTAFVGCNDSDGGRGQSNLSEDKGAYINMYLTDMVYDLDPANAYANESALKLISLLYENLFYVDKNGNLKKELATKYEIIEDKKTNEYKMVITLDGGTWSDGIAVTANDVVYAWRRVLDPENSSAAAALLFDIKNARAVKTGVYEGEQAISIDDVGISSLNEKEVEIVFEGPIDYQQFLRNISCYALVPLREEVVLRNGADWAKKPATIVTSGPFKLRVARYDEEIKNDELRLKEIVLERNMYYHRDPLEDKYDKAVKPYRININYSLSADEIMKAYEKGEIFYVGDIPLALRKNYKDEAKITDTLSAHTYIPNHNATISKVKGGEGDKIFAIKEVREALSLAIDRDAIANAVVFAKAATGLVPYGVFDSTSDSKLFREIGGDVIATKANLNEAQNLLAKANVNASDYKFEISVAAYDEVHMAIAEMVKDAWCELGFNVTVKPIDVMVNDEISNATGEVPEDIKDDLFMEAYQAGDFEVIAVDSCAISVDAFSVLAPFAAAFSGEKIDMSTENGQLAPHISGYNSEAYNAIIERAFAEKDIKKRAEILHEAEDVLLDDMPVIPVIFNQSAVLVSKELSNVKFTYFSTPRLTKTKLKNYEQYLPTEE